MHQVAIRFLCAISWLCLALSAGAETREKVTEIVRILERLDIDQDGNLTVLEVPEGARDFVKRVAEEADFDATHPISLDDLKNKINSQITKLKRERDANLDASMFEVVRSYLYHTYDENMDGAINVSESKTLTVKDRQLFEQIGHRELLQSIGLFRHLDVNSNGVLETKELDLVFKTYLERLVKAYNLDFGAERRIDDLQSQITTRFKRTSSKHQTVSSLETDYERQTRRRMYATNLIGIYDQNGDGVLQSDEWKRLSPSWRENDRDADGRLTVNELSDGLRRIVSTSGTPAKDSTSGIQRTVLRRLPDGLPKWFLDRDAAGNGDGQVQMVEFASEWDEQKLRTFRGLDSNNDGVIEPAEFLRQRNK